MISRLMLFHLLLLSTLPSIQAGEVVNSTIEFINSTLSNYTTTADQSDIFSTTTSEDDTGTILAIVIPLSICFSCCMGLLEGDCDSLLRRIGSRTRHSVPEEDDVEETVVPEAVGVTLRTEVQQAITIASSPSSLSSRRQLPHLPPLTISEPRLQEVAPAEMRSRQDSSKSDSTSIASPSKVKSETAK